MKRRELIRRKHDMRRKLHTPLSIQYRGKADSACVECSCGYADLVATWYVGAAMTNVSPVHSAQKWDTLVDAVDLFLAAIHPPVKP